MPKISIITASYNYQDYIKDTIQSVLNQSMPNWEMIIVDDGSKDDSVNVIKSYVEKDSRIKLFQHENNENKGLAETIKLGLEKSTGDWIVFLESDDTIAPNYLEEKLKIVKEYKNVNYIFNDIKFIGEENSIKSYNFNISKIRQYMSKVEFPRKMKDLFVQSDMDLISTFSIVMMKKELLGNVDFNSPVKKYLDYYLWLQILDKAVFYYVPGKLTNWRMHSDSYVNKKDDYYNHVKFDYVKRKMLFKDNNPIFNIYIPYVLNYLKYVRKSLIMLHLSEGEIILLGKEFKFRHKYRKI